MDEQTAPQQSLEDPGSDGNAQQEAELAAEPSSTLREASDVGSPQLQPLAQQPSLLAQQPQMEPDTDGLVQPAPSNPQPAESSQQLDASQPTSPAVNDEQQPLDEPAEAPSAETEVDPGQSGADNEESPAQPGLPSPDTPLLEQRQRPTPPPLVHRPAMAQPAYMYAVEAAAERLAAGRVAALLAPGQVLRLAPNDYEDSAKVGVLAEQVCGTQ